MINAIKANNLDRMSVSGSSKGKQQINKSYDEAVRLTKEYGVCISSDKY
jgi:hypothetical protein